MKRRLHCLHAELRVDPGRACKIILACVLLFNLSKNFTVHEEEQYASEEFEEDAEVENNGYTMRQAIVNNFFS